MGNTDWVWATTNKFHNINGLFGLTQPNLTWHTTKKLCILNTYVAKNNLQLLHVFYTCVFWSIWLHPFDSRLNLKCVLGMDWVCASSGWGLTWPNPSTALPKCIYSRLQSHKYRRGGKLSETNFWINFQKNIHKTKNQSLKHSRKNINSVSDI